MKNNRKDPRQIHAEKSINQIAVDLGVTKQTVLKHLRRAEAKIKAAITEDREATMIIGLDPGSEYSAAVIIDPDNGNRPTEHALLRNSEMLTWLRMRTGETLAIEMVASYGMPVGATTFETCVWVGRFVQIHQPGDHTFVYRKKRDVCESISYHLCKSNRGNDATIRRALLDKYPATGGGKCPQVGTKADPGPLYGMKSHLWSALAVAVTYAETI